MHDPLERLYRTKLALLATLLTAVGLGLLILAHWIPTQQSLHWLTNWPILDIGSGLFTTGLLGVALHSSMARIARSAPRSAWSE